MDEIEATLIETVRVRYGRVTTVSTPLSALGVDSMQMADLVADLEHRFAIEVDQDVFDAETIGELAQYVRERQACRAH